MRYVLTSEGEMSRDREKWLLHDFHGVCESYEQVEEYILSWYAPDDVPLEDWKVKWDVTKHVNGQQNGFNFVFHIKDDTDVWAAWELVEVEMPGTL